MYAPRLLFFPAAINNSLNDYQALQQALFDIQLIQRHADKNGHFLLADACLDLLTFLGCAPSINLSPEDGEVYCYVDFIAIAEQAKCLGYVQSFSPSCSACKTKISQWHEDIDWKNGLTELSCPACRHQRPLQDIRWRKEAAYARCGFYISNIHPHEALPADKLLDTLQKVSGFKWAYAYANNQEIL